MVTSPTNSLPPELLQKVWGFLPFFDLLRCQGVCKGWNPYLPGDDQALHRVLFSPATVATTPGTASWDVYIDFRQHHRVQNGALPRLVFSLDVTTSALGHGETMRKTPTGKWVLVETHHPILKDTHAFASLIYPEFPGRYQSFEFNDVQDLKLLEKEPESNNASWQKMLARVLVVKKMKADVQWQMNIPYDRDNWRGTEKNHILENDNGVTVGDFVQLVRQELKNAATELTNYGGRLTTIEYYN
jgi:hypothetical protein